MAKKKAELAPLWGWRLIENAALPDVPKRDIPLAEAEERGIVELLDACPSYQRDYAKERESTAGTPVAATTIWRGPAKNLQDDRAVEHVEEDIGIAIPTTRTYIGQIAGSLSMEATPATFEQILHLFEAGIKTVGTGVADGAGTGKIYAYPIPTTSLNTIKTYTIESGDNQQAEEMEDWIGRQVSNVSFTGALSAPTVEEILAAKGVMYIDAVGGTIGSTQVTQTLLEFSLELTTGWKAKYTLDSGQLYFDFVYFDKDSFEMKLEVTYEHNSTAVAEKTAWRNETKRLIRLEFLGSALGTPDDFTYKTLRLDSPGFYESFDALDNDDGNSIVKASLVCAYDETAALAPSLTVVNLLSSVP